MKKWLLCLPALCLTACLSNEAGLGTENETSGRLILVPAGAVGKTPESQNPADAYEFTLDSTKTSFSQYFTLQNTGDFDITDIELVTDNPNVVFSPSHIETLASRSRSTFNPVVELRITHGNRQGSEGWGGLLPRGPLTIKASATARTSGPQGGTFLLSEIMTFHTFVKVADIDVTDNGATLDLFHPSGSVIGPSFPVSTWIPYYNASDAARVLNTGNTSVKVRFWAGTSAVDSLTVRAGESARVGRGTLEIDAGGVASDPSKLRRVNDGRVFFVLRAAIMSPGPAASFGAAR